ncbi:MAG: hypothetical protein JO271_00960 [Verrucomicrobia bacterium]|nr:hypothetical protein [Verrucomicrobiota bacterium]
MLPFPLAGLSSGRRRETFVVGGASGHERWNTTALNWRFGESSSDETSFWQGGALEHAAAKQHKIKTTPPANLL